MAFHDSSSLGTTVEVSEIESLALGALIVGDGSGAPSTLTVGSNGALIQALSSESSGLVWRTSLQLVDALDWSTGVAATAGDYSILRNNDTTNRLQLNVPSGAQIELSVNDQAQMILSSTEVNFQDNPVAIAGDLTLGASLDLVTQTSAPTTLANKGRLYTQNVAGATELYYRDSAGFTVQITGGGTLSPTSVKFDDDEFLVFGTGNDVSIGWETADADAHYLNIFLGTSRNIIISEDGNVDWTHAAQTNPTLWIQSADSATVADYVSIAHDQTNAQIGVGAGDLILTIAGGKIVPSANDAWALGVSGTGISDLFLASGAVINFAAGDVTLTHASNEITVGGGNLFVADTFGLVIGHTAVLTAGDATVFQVTGTGTADSGILLSRFVATGGAPRLDFLKSRSATIGTSTIVNDNDIIGIIRFFAADGNDLTTAVANMTVEVDDASPALDDIGAAFVWNSLPGGGDTTINEVMRLSATGDLTSGSDDYGGLGVSGTGWADLFLSSGAVINFSAGDVVITHSTNTLAFTGGTNYTFDDRVTISGEVVEDGTTATTGAGAVAVTGSIHEITTNATGNALTLADGIEGQLLRIVYVAEGAGADTAVLTPTNLAGAPTTITFAVLGDAVTLLFTAATWFIVGANGVVVA